MCTCDATDVDALADEILRYLHGHKRAADTPEGITRWWIKRQRLEDSLLRVKAALDLLVSRSQVASRQNPAGRMLYCLPPALSTADHPLPRPARADDPSPTAAHREDPGTGG